MVWRPASGDRFIVEEEFRAPVRLYWRTGQLTESERSVPSGLELVVIGSPTMVAKDVAVHPVDPQEHEHLFVDDPDSSHETYGGYALIVRFDALRTHCKPVG